MEEKKSFKEKVNRKQELAKERLNYSFNEERRMIKMEETKKESKNESKNVFKDFWNEHGQKIKIGVKCLTIGFLVGYVKGVIMDSKIHSEQTCRLLDRIPYEQPDDDDNVDDLDI